MQDHCSERFPRETSETPPGGQAATVTQRTWDAESRETSIVQTTNLTQVTNELFTYNADGLRVATSGTAETKKIVWDGQAYLLETDNANVTQVVYTQGVGPFGDLISQRRSGATSYYLFDALGSTDRLISAAQAVLNSYIYRAFGEIAASAGSTANPFRFVGRYGYYYYGWSVGSDLYVRARWYKPVQARWLSRDPLGFAAGDWNLFRYVGNRVAFLTDPSGSVPVESVDSDECRVSAEDPDCRVICDSVRVHPILGAGRGGGVFCLNGKKCACVLVSSGWLPPGRCPEVDACIIDHEKQHFDDVICLGERGLTGTVNKDPRNRIARECVLRRESVVCLFRAISNSSAECRGQISKVQADLREFISRYCQDIPSVFKDRK